MKLLARLGLATVVSLAALSGCASPEAGEALGEGHAAIVLAPGEGEKILALVNYPGTLAATLDGDAGLDQRAAENIIAHRNGPDGVSPSADDNLFDTIEELDAIAYVGDAALSKLLAHAQAHPSPPAETVEGVYFAGWQSEAVIWGVNQSSVAELDDGVGLNSTAANALATAAPFQSVATMGGVAYVGPSALTALRDHAAAWWNERLAPATDPGMSGTYDGVVFDAEAASLALEIANLATLQELTEDGGVYTSGANAIIGARPFTTLAAVAQASGVGTATMQALKSYALSGTWGQESCTDFDPTVVSQEADYAAKLDAFDPRAQQQHYRTKTLSVAACFDPGDPEHAAAMHQLVLDLAGWSQAAAAQPSLFVPSSIKAGPGKYRQMLQSSLDDMMLLRDVRVEDGDAGALAEYDALYAASLPLLGIVQAHPTQTWSTGVFYNAPGCSEQAALMIDLATGTALFMVRPGQC
jgi:DNA uptake protein ComE-like DNA-binding protein